VTGTFSLRFFLESFVLFLVTGITPPAQLRAIGN
jgi:hypothetical protein